MAYSNEIVSTMGYLIGLDTKYFKDKNEEGYFVDIRHYHRLENVKPAKIVRNLCLMRLSLLNNFKVINNAIHGYSKGIKAGIYGFSEYIGEGVVEYLETVGIKFSYHRWAAEYIIDINRYLSDRINNCKQLFPDFVEWNYIKNLFIMPDGTTNEGCKKASDIFYSNKSCYPFSVYMNWKLLEDERGKALYNDYYFLTSIYKDNKSSFDRPELVANDYDNNVGAVSSFLLNGQTEIVVDCENANPFFIYAFLNAISDENYNKISKVLLFNDVNASTAWKSLVKQFHDITFEEVSCERLLERKSMVDVRLITRTVKEYYENNIRSFILVSSDSDFYGMIQELPDAEFLLVMERKQTSCSMTDTAQMEGISYIYSEDYSYKDAYEFKKNVIIDDFKRELAVQWPQMDLANTVDFIADKSYADLTDGERDKILKDISHSLKITVDPEYTLQVVFENKKK